MAPRPPCVGRERRGLLRRLSARLPLRSVPARLTALGVTTGVASTGAAAVAHLTLESAGLVTWPGGAVAAWGGVLLGSAAMSAALAYRLQRLVSVPLLRLAAATRVVTGEHRYDVRVSVDDQGEIGELVAGFNEMLGVVQRRDDELQAHRAGLERTVAERTAELRAANAALVEARDRAMDGSRAKSEFLANVSHEIRTPMNGILGMTELALQAAPDEAQRETLGVIKASATTLLAILNDVLDFSKIESRRLELEAVPFSPAEVMRASLTPMAGEARRKGLSLVNAVSPGVPATLVGDPLRFRQVVTNLVGNAIKFTEHGSVRVDMRAEPLDGHRSRLHVTVTDTGIGIPPDRQDLIFEAFRQADGSTTRRFGGTGLGLAISASLVRLMQGQIRVDSRPGQGSVFHFTMVLDAPPPAPRVAEQGTASPAEPFVQTGDSRRVLLVEDNAVNQRVAVGMLEKRGHRVTVVGNGLEAVEATAGAQFDVVLMDLQMPVMDGLTATATIRARERDRGRGRTPIVAMTAHAHSADRARCLAAGMDGFVTKPVAPAALYEAVEAAVQAPPARTGPRPAPQADAGRHDPLPIGVVLATS